MRSKLFVTFIGFFLVLFSQISYGWREDYDDSDEASSQIYYSNDNQYSYADHYSDYNDQFSTVRDDETVRETRHSFYRKPRELSGYESFISRLPKQIETNEKTIVIDPHVHAWGAYSAQGKLIRAGLATAGAKWCEDIGRPCRTKTGVFRIQSLGDSDCISNKFPVDEGGGAPMPYCMYFNGGQALHGSHELAEANLSHGCVRIHVQDAQWLRFEFANIGTKVIVKPY